MSKARMVARFLEGSWRREYPALSVTAQDVACIAPLLIGSGAAALGWRRVKATPALRDCAEAQDLCQSGRILALEDSRHDQALEYVATLLNNVGVEPLIVKGWAVAQFYGARYLRAYGDFDICPRPRQYTLALETLSCHSLPQFSNPVDPGLSEKLFVDCRPYAKVCTVDLHRNFTTEYMPSVETLFARSSSVRVGAGTVRLLALEDHLRLVIMHFLRHGAWRPAGLCDVAAMVEAIPANFDWKLCLSDDKVVAGWIGATIMLAHRLLGCRLDAVPFGVRADPPLWFERAALREWEAPYASRFMTLASGSFLKRLGDFLPWLYRAWPSPIAALVHLHSPADSKLHLPRQTAVYIVKGGSRLQRYMRTSRRHILERAGKLLDAS